MKTVFTKVIFKKPMSLLIVVTSLLGLGSALAGETPAASTPDVAASQLGDNVECTKEYSKSGLKNLDLEKTGGKEAGAADKKSSEGN